jgi:hypothetical protein
MCYMMVCAMTMTNRDKAEQIAQTVRNLQEELSAWKSLATENCSQQKIHLLELQVLTEVSDIQSDADYREHVGQFLKALDAATDDTHLLHVLYEEVQCQSSV